MAIQRYYVNGDMTALRNALIASNFFGDCTIDLDIDWDDYTTVSSVTSFPAEGNTTTVYVKTDESNWLYTYDGENYKASLTSVSNAGSVSTVSRPATIRIINRDGVVLFVIGKDPCANTRVDGLVQWSTAAGNDNFITSNTGTTVSTTYASKVEYVYSCANGVIMHVFNAYNAHTPIRIVKTNDGRYAFISNRNSQQYSVPQTPSGYPSNSGGYCSNLDCIAYGDVDPISTFLIPNSYSLHYEVIPMLTNSTMDVLSYTDKSGYLQYSTQDLKVKIVTIGGHKYLTDSYFAIFDE